MTVQHAAGPNAPCELSECDWALQGGHADESGKITPAGDALTGTQPAGSDEFAVEAAGTSSTKFGYLRATLTSADGRRRQIGEWRQLATTIADYDLDEMSAAYSLGGTALLCVKAAETYKYGAAAKVNLLPGSETTLGPVGEFCAKLEAAGLSVKAIVAAMAAGYGVGVLPGLVAGDAHQGSGTPTNPPGSGSTNRGGSGNAPAPDTGTVPGGSGQGEPGGPVIGTIEPGPNTIEAVVEVWQQRVNAGRLGTSDVADEKPNRISAEILRKAARQCLILAAAAAGAGVDFAGLPNPCQQRHILFPAGDGNGNASNDAHEAAKHDLHAMTLGGHPEWFQLNYMARGVKEGQVPVRWYNAQAHLARSGCTYPAAAGMQCDEYPLYATTQGGPSMYNGQRSDASLRPINAKQNEAEGRTYSAMVSTSVCGMISAPAAPRGTKATGGTPFLVVPLPGLPVPSFFLC